MGRRKKRIPKKINRWGNALRIIEVSAVLLATVFAVWQLRIAVAQMENVRSMQSAQVMLTFNQDLNRGENLQVAVAIENGEAIFKENGGEFSAIEVDRLLSIFEFLNNARNEGLINDDMAYSAFDYTMQKTYKHPEIVNYLKSIREDDPLLFLGGEELAVFFEQSYNQSN